MVQLFYTRATNGRTIKIKHEDGAPNIGRSVFRNSNFRMNSSAPRSHSRHFRHTNQLQDTLDVITYPLIQETFALVESSL
jgi:hypothetical protein